LGCGRGEWIELLKENGWNVQGIDTNASMIKFCQTNDLPVFHGDAIDFLKSLKDNSISVISGIHIAEHLPFELVLELVREAHRTLLPGGMLILETPNPENNIVRANNFYIDPTHRNPLPPVLMQFIAKDSGFSKSVIIRLNGPEKPDKNEPISRLVYWALSANPDYGLIAQKKPVSHEDSFIALDRANSEQVDGLTIMNNLIIRFENEIEVMKDELSKRTNELEATLDTKETERQGFEELINELEATLDTKETERQGLEELIKDTEVRLNNISFHRDQLITELDQVYQSRSFRVTKPLRVFLRTARKWKSWLTHRTNRPDSNLATSQFNNADGVGTDELVDIDSGIQEINLDDVMERIRAEVTRRNAQSQGNDFRELRNYTSTKQQETKLFRFVKWAQLVLQKFPFYKIVYNSALKFKAYIPRFQTQGLSIGELLKFDDEDFIKSAYKAILRREPDEEGFNNYISKLRSQSLSKTRILGRLRYSPEGRQAKVYIKGLFTRYFVDLILRK